MGDLRGSSGLLQPGGVWGGRDFRACTIGKSAVSASPRGRAPVDRKSTQRSKSRDALSPPRGATAGRPLGPGGHIKPPELKIRHDEDPGEVYLENLIWEDCDTARSLHSVLERGQKQRNVSATHMNIESSRSHLLLLVR